MDTGGWRSELPGGPATNCYMCVLFLVLVVAIIIVMLVGWYGGRVPFPPVR